MDPDKPNPSRTPTSALLHEVGLSLKNAEIKLLEKKRPAKINLDASSAHSSIDEKQYT
jgi:hypothetical protein